MCAVFPWSMEKTSDVICRSRRRMFDVVRSGGSLAYLLLCLDSDILEEGEDFTNALELSLYFVERDGEVRLAHSFVVDTKIGFWRWESKRSKRPTLGVFLVSYDAQTYESSTVYVRESPVLLAVRECIENFWWQRENSAATSTSHGLEVHCRNTTTATDAS